MKIVKWFFLCAGLLFVGVATGASVRLFAASAPKSIDYVDVVTIILASLSVLLTVLGLGFAVLAVIGWATFESKLRDNSFRYFAEQLGRDGPLRRELESLLVQISLEGVESAKDETPPKNEIEGDYVE